MKALRPILGGCLVAFVTAGGLRLIHADVAAATVLSLILGGVVAYMLAMLSSNRAVALVPADLLRRLPERPDGAGTTLLYVYRDGFVGKLLGIDVRLDGAPLAQLQSPRFTRVAVMPGRHVLQAAPPGAFAAAQNASGETEFEATGGETIAFRIRVSLGLLRNRVVLERDHDLTGALGKAERMPMVEPEVR